MVKYEIRPAVELESAQIKNLIYLVGINPTGLDWKRFTVAVNDGGEVIACGQVKPHGADLQEMASIAVSPAYRGQGIGREIIEELVGKKSKPFFFMCVGDNGA